MWERGLVMTMTMTMTMTMRWWGKEEASVERGAAEPRPPNAGCLAGAAPTLSEDGFGVFSVWMNMDRRGAAPPATPITASAGMAWTPAPMAGRRTFQPLPDTTRPK